MGFGILLLGYLFTTDVEVAVNTEHQIGFDVLPDLIGFIIMFYALTMLKNSYSAFSASRKAIYPLFVTSSAILVCQAISFFKVAPALISNILSVVIAVQRVLLIVFHVLLFKAAKQLANEIDLPELGRKLGRSLVFSSVFYSVHLILILLFPFASKMGAFSPFFNLAYYLSLLLQYFVLFYNIISLYKCYMFIGYEGEDTSTNVKHPIQRLIDTLKK